MRTSSILLSASAAALLVLSACSDDSSDGAAGAAGAAGSGEGGSAVGGSSGSGEGGAAGSSLGGSAGAPDAGDDATIGPVQSCSEIPGSVDCFANLDCPADRRCQNAGTDTEQVPCCVTGSRGTGAAGTQCSSENDCESAVCVEGLCSKNCTTPADCPDNLKQCIPIAFSGSNEKWCLPESP